MGPGSITLRTSDPGLVAQITHRKNDFPKPVENYTLLEIFGVNIVVTEGADWRRHKKVVGPGFSEKNNKNVFEESLRHANNLLKSWSSWEGNDKSDMKVDNMAPDFMTLSFYIICAVGFDLPQKWPTQQRDKLSNESDDEIPDGHTLSFNESMQTLMRGIKWIALIPPRFLSMCADCYIFINVNC